MTCIWASQRYTLFLVLKLVVKRERERERGGYICLSDDSFAILCLSVRGSGMPANADASIVLASAWSALPTCHT